MQFNLTSSNNDVGLAIDSQRAGRLQSMVEKDPAAARKAVAKEFEAMFLSMMLKSMREATPDFDPLSGQETKMFRGMLDEQWSMQLSGQQNTGLTQALLRQMGEKDSAVVPPHFQPYRFGPVHGNAGLSAMTSTNSEAPIANPDHFLQQIAPQAQSAASALGVSPHLLMAHAALESGWGKQPIRDAAGNNSHNLFGIKAGSNWQGKVAEVTTTEYVNGTPQKQVERFRAYDSYADAFNDYAQLLYSRYGGVVGQKDDAASFAQSLAKGGYATDPAYANKLTEIASSPRLARWRSI